MSGAVDKLLADVKALAEKAAEQVSDRFENDTRPRLAQLLEDSVAVQIRFAAGEGIITARTALEASLANLTREERAVLAHHARDVAFRAVLGVALRLAGAVAGA